MSSAQKQVLPLRFERIDQRRTQLTLDFQQQLIDSTGITRFKRLQQAQIDDYRQSGQFVRSQVLTTGWRQTQDSCNPIEHRVVTKP